jgi:hypothetical protein
MPTKGRRSRSKTPWQAALASTWASVTSGQRVDQNRIWRRRVNSIVTLALAVPTQVRADLLYVSSYNTGMIETITPDGTTSVCASGLNVRYGMAFDSAGNLYSSLAFDAAGNLFVANYYTDVITEYTPGGVGTLFSTAVSEPSGLVFSPTAAVPEPSSLLIMCGGLGVIGAASYLHR